MPATDRHAEMVAAVAADARTEPVTRADLPPLSAARRDAAAAEAAAQVDSARARHGAAEDRLRALRDELATTARRREAAERASAAADQLRASLVARGDDLRGELQALDGELAELSEALGAWESRAAAASSCHRSLAEATAAVGSGPIAPEERAQLATGLSKLASDLVTLGLEEGAAHLEGWSQALASDTAPRDPEAQDLLAALDELDRAWSEHGAGDPSADPLVLGAREELLAAQEAVAKLESQARSGNLGERLRRVIEQAHAKRVEIEERGRRSDLEELTRAREAEAEALGLVGFDSMLDFRVAMSTSGSGALAESQRLACEERLARAKQDLERQIEASRERHDQLRRRGAELEQRARALVGGTGDDWRSALSTLLAVPEPVRVAAAALADVVDEAQRGTRSTQERLASLDGRRQELASALDRSTQDAQRAADEAEDARDEVASASEQLADGEARAAAIEAERDAAQRELDAAEEAARALERRGYVDADVQSLRDALVDLLRLRTAEVSRSVLGPGHEAAPPSAVVVDDPLDELGPDDAVAVLQAVLATELPAPVRFVTSRPELLEAARRHGGQVTCVDGRRRVRQRRWRRRTRATSPVPMGHDGVRTPVDSEAHHA